VNKKFFLDETKSIPSTLPKSERAKQEKVKVWKPRNLLFTFFRNVGRDSTAKINDFIQVNKHIL
jgi:hypothetical protein